jgi:CRISPR-associated endonuclease/helicase Cas3
MREPGVSVPGSTPADVDARLWGKRHGFPRPYPVVCHLLDTAAMAGALFDDVLGSVRADWLADAAGVPRDHIRGLAMYWAGLHDIGKISPPFQAKVPELFALLKADERYESAPMADGDRGFHHSHASQFILGELLAASGYPLGKPRRTPTHVAHQIAQLLGGHHGRFHAKLSSDDLVQPRGPERSASLGFGEWARQARLHAQVLRELIGPGAQIRPRDVLPTAAVAVLFGLVVCSDWLASQEDFIIRGARLPSPDWIASTGNLEEHWASACGEVHDEVRAAGLGRARFIQVPPGEAGFRERFPKIAEPNQLQRSLATLLPDVARGPGLLLVTAPTGDGKTEAAAFSAGHLAQVSGAGGLAFALPTQTTSDAMFRRIRMFAGHNLAQDASLALVHGMAWLNTDYEDLAQGSVGGSRVATSGGGAPFATDWLRGRGRGLHAALGVMTIDQLLIGVLPTKFNMLRIYGLSTKVVVIDEAHSYGPWMHSLMLKLLQWLGAMQVPVILMSATLAGATARSLLDAYRIGSGHGRLPEEMDTAPYPGWVFLDAGTGTLSKPVGVGTDRPRKLEFQLESVRRPSGPSQPSVGTDDDRLTVLARLLAPLREQDGCVLVCCNTVAEAQETYAHLAAEFAGVADVRILHARFRSGDRARITEECEEAFGKPAQEGEPSLRPAKAIFVATQIVEQSIDLDFDVVVSDLAPIAALLQRAGRCRRHDRGTRPAWTGEPGMARMIVLDPVDDVGEYVQPAQWGSVYYDALLRKTRRELACLQAPVDIPADVQQLVDAVYAETFTLGGAECEDAALFAAEQKQYVESATERQLAGFVALAGPHDIRDLADLSGRTKGGLIDEALITTRLGADSARVVLAYQHADGRLTLDAAGIEPVPSGTAKRPLHAGQVRAVMRSTTPVPGWWVRGVDPQTRQPEGWSENPLLRDLILAEGREEAGGRWRGVIGATELEYQTTSGLIHL